MSREREGGVDSPQCLKAASFRNLFVSGAQLLFLVGLW
jgi:hypothetical protein